MKVGDLLQIPHGPVEAQAKVTRIEEHGAVIEYTGRCTFVGGLQPTLTPDGKTRLANGGKESWIGKAHWASYEDRG